MAFYNYSNNYNLKIGKLFEFGKHSQIIVIILIQI